MKASTTICRLVLSFLSQFFQSRRHFSSQAKDRSTTHRFGSTTKVCSSLRFTTSTEAPNRPCTRSGKGLPGVTPVHQHVLHLTEAVSAPVKHRQSPGPVGNVGGSHVYPMGQSLRVHRDVTLDSRHLLARVIALVPGGVRVLHALGVHDTEAGLLFPSIASSGRANRFFLGLAPEWNPDLGQAARSIAGNTGSRCANRESPRAGIRHWHPLFRRYSTPQKTSYKSTVRGVGPTAGPTPTSAEYGRIAPG